MCTCVASWLPRMNPTSSKQALDPFLGSLSEGGFKGGTAAFGKWECRVETITSRLEAIACTVETIAIASRVRKPQQLPPLDRMNSSGSQDATGSTSLLPYHLPRPQGNVFFDVFFLMQELP